MRQACQKTYLQSVPFNGANLKGANFNCAQHKCSKPNGFYPAVAHSLVLSIKREIWRNYWKPLND